MFDFAPTTRLHLAQLLTLLTLAWRETPEHIVRERFVRASRHLMGLDICHAENEPRCPVTGDCFGVTQEGTQIRHLLTALVHDGVCLDAGQLKAYFCELSQTQLARWSAQQGQESGASFTRMAGLTHLSTDAVVARMAGLMDLSAEAVLRYGSRSSSSTWTWWDADLVSLRPRSRSHRWLIRRTDVAGMFERDEGLWHETYLCGFLKGDVWTVRVDEDCKLVWEAEAALIHQGEGWPGSETEDY